ncbi:MAG: hypothetical protein P1P77_14440 [Spirochaetaceae bacterium]|nr:hypothetical protein [Spirochaetaceae bacterium]
MHTLINCPGNPIHDSRPLSWVKASAIRKTTKTSNYDDTRNAFSIERIADKGIPTSEAAFRHSPRVANYRPLDYLSIVFCESKKLRLLHHVHIVSLQCDSYRMKDRMKMGVVDFL